MRRRVKYGLSVLGALICSFGLQGQLVIDEDVIGLETDHTGGFLGTGMSFADFNGDGVDDLSFGHHEGELKFYIGQGNGFVPIELDLVMPDAQSKGLLWADIDNDGDQDLFVAFRLAPNKLWINEGDMQMVDVSATCGIAQDNRRSFGPAYGDYDRDGLLDLFVSNYGYAVDVPPGNELYRNLGNGQFEDVTEEMGMGGTNLQSFQASWMDADRDGWLDLHVVRDRLIYPNLFYHNKGLITGEAVFEEEAAMRGLDVSINCMSSSPHDFDRDGDLDLFVAGGLEGNELLQNNGDGFYSAVTSEILAMYEVCWSGQWMDVDADGWEELHVATGTTDYIQYPAVLMDNPNEPDELFVNVSGSFNPPGSLFQAESTLSFSTATGDYNNDGFIDFVSHKIGLAPEVRSGTANGNNTLLVLLHGSESNADAIGSKIELWAGSDYWYRETYAGEGYLAQNSRWEHFGLANHMVIDSIQIHWPLGLIETWYDVAVPAQLELTEGSSCVPSCIGCTYEGACNFTPDAQTDDGSCDFSCLIADLICGTGLIWNPTTAQCEDPCPADFTGDNQVDVSDLLVMLGAFSSFCP
ncbi:MAG TPA: hypothetical protein DD635_06905 [Flavobacteriales bacterium]|nr:hypothetical protein [Flavobacteriales bacterium]